MEKIWQFASYNLLNSIEPAVGLEHLHCDMKRGFIKARKKEPEIKAASEENTVPQIVGLLAQKAVYEYHQSDSKLEPKQIARNIAKTLELEQAPDEIRQRVLTVIIRYCKHPILADKEIIQLARGDEGFPKPLLIEQGNYRFNFYAAIDCIVREADGTLHIIDFKTGKSGFDRRQGYIYLLAATYLYPNQRAIASFYNLESGQWSEPLTASTGILAHYQSLLARIAKQHQNQLWDYRKHPERFAKIFPANPGLSCRSCSFRPYCEFYQPEVIE